MTKKGCKCKCDIKSKRFTSDQVQRYKTWKREEEKRKAAKDRHKRMIISSNKLSPEEKYHMWKKLEEKEAKKRHDELSRLRSKRTGADYEAWLAEEQLKEMHRLNEERKRKEAEEERG